MTSIRSGTTSTLTARTRFIAMFIDHCAMTLMAMIPVAIAICFNAGKNSANTSGYNSATNYIGLIGFAVYFCKDSFRGRSIAKRLLKLQVVDNSSGQAASPLKCLVRNLFCILWPVEVIMTLRDPSRRIGDRVAGTRVILFDPAAIPVQADYRQILLCFVLAYGFMLVAMLPVW
jgi:uncharacterized RDD family membrane protein YckC